jgi:hypothetical protein
VARSKHCPDQLKGRQYKGVLGRTDCSRHSVETSIFLSRGCSQYHFTMTDESSQVEKPRQPVPPQPVAQAATERKHRKLDSDEFKAKLEMTKAFCDTAKGYAQISSAGLALPLLFQQAMLGKVRNCRLFHFCKTVPSTAICCHLELRAQESRQRAQRSAGHGAQSDSLSRATDGKWSGSLRFCSSR